VRRERRGAARAERVAQPEATPDAAAPEPDPISVEN